MPSYKAFPPSWGPLRIPLSSRRAALAGLSLYSACRPRALLAQRTAWVSVALLGPRALTGRSAPWDPIPPAEWQALEEAWRAEFGAFDEIAGYQRTDPTRGGVAMLLLNAGRAVAFVKARRGDDASLAREVWATQAAWRAPLRSFRVAEPLGSGEVAGWTFAAFAPLPARPHQPPAHPPLHSIVAELDQVLDALPRSAATPANWRPMHGDFTPWNLRQTDGRALYLVDWEDVSWAPPGADEVLYRATAAALNHQPAQPVHAPEAIAFWRARIAARCGDQRDQRLRAGIL
ncbi:MAG TPA: phosphotransferase, partial [Gemmatimonadaceae bacterium]|nr:phosphotransferase [Gemmatimonadaceae bacterium]